MDVVLGLLPPSTQGPPPRVAVLAGPVAAPADLVDALSARARTDTFDAAQALDRLHTSLAARGPFDLVLDVAGAGLLDRISVLSGHVRAGGAYVGVLGDHPAYDEAAAWADRLTDVRNALRSGESVLPGRKAKRRRDLAVLATSLVVHLEDRFLIAVNEIGMLAKIREESTDEFLRGRAAADRVVATVPGMTWTSRAVVRSSRPHPLNDLPGSYSAPPLSLRAYHDAVCLPRQAAYGEAFVLAESFRDNQQPRLQNPAFEDWTELFVRRPEPPASELAGSFFHLDTHVPGHFGHALTEQVSHLWGWQEARRRDPSVRALVFGPADAPAGAPLAEWTYALLAAGGVPREDIVVCEQPVRVEQLLASTPAYNIRRYAHPVLADAWERIGATLAAGPGGPDAPDRVFLTRTGQKRSCHNRVEVEETFAAAGFTVLRPETLPLAEQVRLVRGASVVAGFAGSAMFHIALAERPRHVVVVTTETYPAHNEYLMSALHGHRLDLVVCPPDVPRREPDRFTLESFHSDYTLDLAGSDGAFLRAVLADL